MFSSKEELNELENESPTATGSPFGEIVTTHSRRIYVENHFISIHTKSFFCCFNCAPPGSASVPICATVDDLKAGGVAKHELCSRPGQRGYKLHNTNLPC